MNMFAWEPLGSEIWDNYEITFEVSLVNSVLCRTESVYKDIHTSQEEFSQ